MPFSCLLQDQLNEPQKRAVLQTAHVCLKSEPKICMIQGPPGEALITYIFLVQLMTGYVLNSVLYGEVYFQFLQLSVCCVHTVQH
jgi:hypothetical protein